MLLVTLVSFPFSNQIFSLNQKVDLLVKLLVYSKKPFKFLFFLLLLKSPQNHLNKQLNKAQNHFYLLIQ